MDPHEKEELEEIQQPEDAPGSAEHEGQIPEAARPNGAPEPAREIVLEAENQLFSLLSVTRTYALTRRNGGMLPKHLCKSVQDVVDDAFSKGLVAFASVEEPGGKHKGLVLTHKGYAALISGEV